MDDSCSQAGAELFGLLAREKLRSLGCPLPVGFAQPGSHDSAPCVAWGQQHVADFMGRCVSENQAPGHTVGGGELLNAIVE